MAGSYEVRAALAEAAGIDLSSKQIHHGDQEHGPDHQVQNEGHGPSVAISPDGRYSIEFVECLASCGTAPVAMVDDLLKEKIKTSEVRKLLKLQKSDATLPKVQPPHPREKRLVFKNIDRSGWTNDLDCYLKDGGYRDLKKALRMKPEEIVEEVKKSGLRGRGGAGFPCGVKWGFIKRGGPKPTYLICNADESEPGTFKDRYIMHQDPHQMIEGMIISCFAVDAARLYLYSRRVSGRRHDSRACVERGARKGFLGRNILGSGFDLRFMCIAARAHTFAAKRPA